MSKKIIYVVSAEGLATVADRFADLSDFNKARQAFAVAADYTARCGYDLDLYDLEFFMREGLEAMPKGHDYTEQIYAAWIYLNKCLNEDNEPYLPYIQNRILDFLEVPYFSASTERRCNK